MAGGGERSFTVQSSSVGGKGGRYMSASPYSAASKAGRVLLKDKKGSAEVKITLRETTQGSAHKEYTYVVKKEKLSKPKVFKRGSTEIKINFVFKVKSA